MKLIFAGSPAFAVPTLERLVAPGTEAHEIALVVTQPDRPTGRKQELQAPPVKEAALRLGLSVFQPEKIKSDESRAHLEAIQPEVMVVVGYGQILPPWLLELPRYGCVNLHASLLPAYRGAAPIQWAIANGDTKTGNTTMLMDPGMDTGAILLQWETEIGHEETAIELAQRLSVAGPELMIQTLGRLEAGTLTPQPQDNSRASRAPLLKKEHGHIDWTLPAQQIANRVRGFLPWPGCYTGFRGKKLQIQRARPYQSRERERPDNAMESHPSRDREGAGHLSDSPLPTDPSRNGKLQPGQLLPTADALLVACGQDTILEILELQLEGRRRMTAAEFLRGVQLVNGELLQPQIF
jgi:methionyl-tRNA formyltransferase